MLHFTFFNPRGSQDFCSSHSLFFFFYFFILSYWRNIHCWVYWIYTRI